MSRKTEFPGGDVAATRKPKVVRPKIEAALSSLRKASAALTQAMSQGVKPTDDEMSNIVSCVEMLTTLSTYFMRQNQQWQNPTAQANSQ